MMKVTGISRERSKLLECDLTDKACTKWVIARNSHVQGRIYSNDIIGSLIHTTHNI